MCCSVLQCVAVSVLLISHLISSHLISWPWRLTSRPPPPPPSPLSGRLPPLLPPFSVYSWTFHDHPSKWFVYCLWAFSIISYALFPLSSSSILCIQVNLLRPPFKVICVLSIFIFICIFIILYALFPLSSSSILCIQVNLLRPPFNFPPPAIDFEGKHVSLCLHVNVGVCAIDFVGRHGSVSVQINVNVGVCAIHWEGGHVSVKANVHANVDLCVSVWESVCLCVYARQIPPPAVHFEVNMCLCLHLRMRLWTWM